MLVDQLGVLPHQGMQASSLNSDEGSLSPFLSVPLLWHSWCLYNVVLFYQCLCYACMMFVLEYFGCMCNMYFLAYLCTFWHSDALSHCFDCMFSIIKTTRLAKTSSWVKHIARETKSLSTNYPGITSFFHFKCFFSNGNILLSFLPNIVEPTVYTNSKFGDGYGPIVYSYVQCNGWEGGIHECFKYEYLQFSCSRSSVSGVLCHDGRYLCVVF